MRSETAAPLFSVIVPVWNRADVMSRMVRDAVAGCQLQLGSTIETIHATLAERFAQ